METTSGSGVDLNRVGARVHYSRSLGHVVSVSAFIFFVFAPRRTIMATVIALHCENKDIQVAPIPLLEFSSTEVTHCMVFVTVFVICFATHVQAFRGAVLKHVLSYHRSISIAEWG